MKILFFLMILFLVSCGPKSESTKAKFRIFSGHSASLATVFKGGILIMGRSADGAQSFILSYQPDLELNLNKGEWEFATIGWTGGYGGGSTIFYPIEGRQQCSHQIVNVNSDNFTVNFQMSYQACKSVAEDGTYFTDPKFYYSGSDSGAGSGSYVGFKKLQVQEHGSNPLSFRVEIPTKLKGITTDTVMGTPLRSRCVPSYNTSFITPPHGGANGVVDIIVTTFSDELCNGGPQNYPFLKGTGRGILSVDPSPNATSQRSADLAEVKFYGDYSGTSVPVVPDSQKALYIYRGGYEDLTLGDSSGYYPLPGEYLYFNGILWSTFMESDSVKLLLPN